jgi:hypothetical protein
MLRLINERARAAGLKPLPAIINRSAFTSESRSVGIAGRLSERFWRSDLMDIGDRGLGVREVDKYYAPSSSQ